ncbi:nucleotidyl transferase AbiEii/AbiGii toxin family protein [Escherichia coli]|uniref:nucleotidyl transferase AbiEii/AbiGii toxin family protein n=1 Tax=Escherichia coli TaxID=562 RepID=UPI0017BB5DCB|nr:nucleotidyl transferase AbiEii/AbiGii toxin family protein [Escherichia coli]EFN7395709.1 nucleotidyl transferase AbiEii/AbiGii toxin family protein [Escherichia coli]EGE7938607.1 nucleotidyl transferase AbiEii/AbiGii toxin family protein [Escherichia coli]EGF8261167.1 nucleotidyl transferase AbiEii/AbiGii toxin family protein [Escherichia coli]EGF8263908.1 nucleotidyl transferase AbiEii/AbiGii toxin family protein [Escherichia coli]EGG0912798.1 nucleotidyl transferase AbiEii/AbiGii toxin f
MDLRDSYARQVKLLMAALPHVAKESCFALKGGTAINLFVQDFPRLSVDIDLAAINDALKRITASLNGRPGITAIRQENKADEKRIIVNTADAKIKIEVSPVWRGLLLPPAEMPVCERVEMEYGFTTMSVVSLADLYGGKICAALDRQHPRDLFDVLNMLEKPGLMREIFDGFLCYLAGHPRPIAELLAPNWDTERITTLYAQEFSGMTQQETSLESLLSVTTLLPQALKSHLTDLDREFLLSFKQNSPDWSRYRYPEIQHLPAIRWKQRNLAVLKDKNPAKYVAAVNKLERVLA